MAVSRLAFPNILQCKKLHELTASLRKHMAVWQIGKYLLLPFLFLPFLPQLQMTPSSFPLLNRPQLLATQTTKQKLKIQQISPSGFITVQTLTPQMIAAHHIAGMGQSLCLTSMLSYNICHLQTKTMRGSTIS